MNRRGALMELRLLPVRFLCLFLVSLRRLNIISDECEHLLDVVPQASGLIPSAAGVNVRAKFSHSAIIFAESLRINAANVTRQTPYG